MCTGLVKVEWQEGDLRADTGHQCPTCGFPDMALVNVKNGSTNRSQNSLGKIAYKNCEYQNKRCYKKYSIDRSSIYIDKESR